MIVELCFFCSKYFDPIVSECFINIPYGPIKSDLWRLCILYIYGGVYSDIDVYPIKPLRFYIKNDLTFIVPISCQRSTFIKRPEICNAFIASVKGNPILKDCINIIIQKYIYVNEITEVLKREMVHIGFYREFRIYITYLIS